MLSITVSLRCINKYLFTETGSEKCKFRMYRFLYNISDVGCCHRLSRRSKNGSVGHETATEGISGGENAWLSVLHFSKVHSWWWRRFVKNFD